MASPGVTLNGIQSVQTPTGDLTVMSYNIQMTPSIFNLKFNWWNRLPFVINYLLTIIARTDPDVIIFQEAFSTTIQLYIHSLGKLPPYFKYQTPVLQSHYAPAKHTGGIRSGTSAQSVSDAAAHSNDQSDNNDVIEVQWDSVSVCNRRILVQNSGVIIISKHPIVSAHGYIFKNARFPDSFSEKGAVFVQVNKFGKLFNIVGTHLQALDQYNTVRLQQISEIAAWLGLSSTNTLQDTNTDASCGPSSVKAFIKPSIPLIFGGDFNFDYYTDRLVVDLALCPEMLNATYTLPPELDIQTSYDTELNDLCFFEENCPKVPRKRLFDFFFLSKKFGGAVKKGQKTIQIPTVTPIPYRRFLLGVIPWTLSSVNHLSDHFAICATFSHDATNSTESD